MSVVSQHKSKLVLCKLQCGSHYSRPDLSFSLSKHTTLPHLLQRHHPPPKPPASLSTIIKLSTPTPTPAYNSLHVEERRGEGRREEERWRNWEVALSGGRLGVRLAGRGSKVTTLTLSLSVSLSSSSLPLPHVGYRSPCLTAVCQTIPPSPLWETGWMPSRWVATVTTLSMLDLLPLTWWPRWQQSEWKRSEFS